jgi:ketosteroid isomerase-like protein
MKRLMFALASILAVACTASAPAQLRPGMREVLKPVNAVMAAVQADNPSAVSGLYAGNAIIVDDQGPFTWSGSNAGSEWLSDVSRYSKWSSKIAHFNGTPVSIESGTDSAYVVVAGTFSGAKPKPWKQQGTLTFTLRKARGDWKITSQVWTRIPMFPPGVDPAKGQTLRAKP